MKQTPSFFGAFKRESFGKIPTKTQSFLPRRWTSSTSRVSRSTRFLTTHDQNANVCTISPTGTERIILVLGQVHSPLSESTVGKISLTRKPTSQKPRWEIRPGYAKSFWRKRPENRNT